MIHCKKELKRKEEMVGVGWVQALLFVENEDSEMQTKDTTNHKSCEQFCQLKATCCTC